MHNIKTNFDKILNNIKPFAQNIVNQADNIPRPGVIPRFSDLQVIALAITAEALSIDSENLMFHKLQTEYKNEFPNLISRRQFNDRRKKLQDAMNEIRYNIVMSIDSAEKYFIVDSKPLPVCRFARARRCKMGSTEVLMTPNYGYCAAQAQTYYGYKRTSIMKSVIVLLSAIVGTWERRFNWTFLRVLIFVLRCHIITIKKISDLYLDLLRGLENGLRLPFLSCVINL